MAEITSLQIRDNILKIKKNIITINKVICDNTKVGDYTIDLSNYLTQGKSYLATFKSQLSIWNNTVDQNNCWVGLSNSVFGDHVGINNVFNNNFECNVYSLPIGTSRTLTVHIMYHDCAQFSLKLLTAIEL